MTNRWGVCVVAAALLGGLVGCTPNTTSPGPGSSTLQADIDRLAHSSPLPPTSNESPGVAPSAQSAVVPLTDPALDALAVPPRPSATRLPTLPTPPPARPVAIDGSVAPAVVIGRPGSPTSTTGGANGLVDSAATLEHVALTTPGLDIVDALTYRVCAETARVVNCTLSVPVGVPILVDVNGDSIPDVRATLTPIVPLQLRVGGVFGIQILPDPVAIGFSFGVQRLSHGSPLPAHVFAVYDAPGTGTRLEYGYDGRSSTLADETTTTVILKHALPWRPNDIEVVASITHAQPGTSEIETIAIETIQRRLLRLPVENALAAVNLRLAPVPASITADIHLRHGVVDEDVIGLDASQPSAIAATLRQTDATARPSGGNQLTVLVDQLPTHASVDVLRDAGKLVVAYDANAPVHHVHVDQLVVGNVSEPRSFADTTADVVDLPSAVRVTLTGASDVRYVASSSVTTAHFETLTRRDGILQSDLGATVHGVPREVHVGYSTTASGTAVAYEASDPVKDITFSMFNRSDLTIVRANATRLPLRAQLTQSATGVTDYTSSGPAGSVELTLSRGGAPTIPLDGVDHATVVQRNGGVGVDLRASGIVAAHVEAEARTLFSLTLSPGGQRFEGVAELDSPNRLAAVDISNLPANTSVVVDPAVGSAAYTADTVVNSIDAGYEQPDIGQIGRVTLTRVSTHVAVSWANGPTPVFTYDAAGRLGSLSVVYRQASVGPAFIVSAADLPLALDVHTGTPFLFEARSSPGASPASDYVGRLRVQYASTGALPSLDDPNDHLLLDLTPASTRADLVYDGLRLVSGDTANGIHAVIETTAPRRFDIALTTADLTGAAFIDRLPNHVMVDIGGPSIRYSGSSAIREIAAVVRRSGGDRVQVDLLGLPASIDLAFDAVRSAVAWHASAAITRVTAVAHLVPSTTGFDRAIDAGISVSGVPAAWDASWAGGHVLVETTSAPIGQIALTFTDHGRLTTLPGDGITVSYDDATKEVDAFLRLPHLSRVEYQPLPSVHGAGGFDATLDLGMQTTSNFAVVAHVVLASWAVQATGSITDLPARLHLRSLDGAISYDGSSSPTIDLAIGTGTVAALRATPEPPRPHGLAVRDGSERDGNAIKAHLFLTGMPRSLFVDPAAQVYRVGGFAPTRDVITVDVALNHVVTPTVRLVARQDGLLGQPIDLALGPIAVGHDRVGAATIHVPVLASRGIGAFAADADVGDQVAHVHVSNVPSSLSVDTAFGPNADKVAVRLGQHIDSIDVEYRRINDAAFVAGAELTHVPQAVDVGFIPGQTGPNATPTVTYHASDAHMGLLAFVDTAAFDPTVRANVQMRAVDLGRDVTIGLKGVGLSLQSSPPTGSFTLVGTGHLHFAVPRQQFTAGPVTAYAAGTVDLTVTQLTIGFTQMSSLTVALGYTTIIAGAYGSFTFGELSDTKLDLHAQVTASGRVLGHIDMNHKDLGNVIGAFRMADNTLARWIAVSLHLPCSLPTDVGAGSGRRAEVVELRPHPRFTTPGAMFTVRSADAAGGSWFATIDPEGKVPAVISDAIAYFPRTDHGTYRVTHECLPRDTAQTPV